MSRLLELITTSSFLSIAFMTTAYAYVDPVSVTFLLQAIAGAIAAVIVGIRSVRTRVMSFLKRLYRTRDSK